MYYYKFECPDLNCAWKAQLCHHKGLLRRSDQVFEWLCNEQMEVKWHTHTCKYELYSFLWPPYSEALSAVQVLNKWAQPCVYWGTPSEEFCVPSVSMWPLFCSGAGMCGAEWYWTMGCFTVDMACQTNWTRPQRDQFPPAKWSAPPGSGSNGLVWLHGDKNRFQASDTWVRLFSYYFIYSQQRPFEMYTRIVNWRTVIKLLFIITTSPYQKGYSLSKWVEWYSKHLRNDKIRRDVWMKASRQVDK